MATIEIQVPTALSDITLEQYLQYEALPENLNDIDRATETIFIFTPLSRGEVSNLSMSDRTAILRMLRQMIGTREHELILHGKLEGVSVSFVPNLDNITLGEFIDIEKYQSDAKNWAMLMQVLYRPLVEHQPLDKYKVLTYEQTLELQLDYSKITMDMVFGALVFFLRFRERLNQLYPEVFEPNAETTQHQHDFGVKWGWFGVIVELSEGDIRRVDEVSRVPIHQALIWLAYKADQAKLQNKLINKR